MSWLNLNAETVRQHYNNNWDDAKVPFERKNIISLPGNAILKIGSGHCRSDYAWLKAIETLRNSELCNIPGWVRVPKLRSELVEFDREGIDLYGFAMETIRLPTLTEFAKTNPISDELADRIVEGLLILRKAIATIQTANAIPDLENCVLQGHMFPIRADDCRTVSSQDDVKQSLEDRVEDGYDWWTLTVPHYSPDFRVPLSNAFARKCPIDSSTHFEAFNKMRELCRQI